MSRLPHVLDHDPATIAARVARHGLVKARKALRIGPTTWFRLLEIHPKLGEMVELAEREYLERLVPRLIGDADSAANDFDLRKAKLIGDRIAWLLERRLPDRYGTKVQMSVAHTFDLKIAVDEARARVEAVGVEVRIGVVAKLTG